MTSSYIAPPVSKHLIGVGTVLDIFHIIKRTWIISTFDNGSQHSYLFTQVVLPPVVGRWRVRSWVQVLLVYLTNNNNNNNNNNKHLCHLLYIYVIGNSI